VVPGKFAAKLAAWPPVRPPTNAAAIAQQHRVLILAFFTANLHEAPLLTPVVSSLTWQPNIYPALRRNIVMFAIPSGASVMDRSVVHRVTLGIEYRHVATIRIGLGIGIGDRDGSRTDRPRRIAFPFRLVVVPVAPRSNIIVSGNEHQFLYAILNQAPHVDKRQRIVIDIFISVCSATNANGIAFDIPPDTRIVIAEPVLGESALAVEVLARKAQIRERWEGLLLGLPEGRGTMSQARFWLASVAFCGVPR
jgi:hypothetical protein